MSLNNVANYNSIASAYSKFVGFWEEEIVVLEEIILQYLGKKEAHILDLGCAHGAAVKALNMKGYQTTGIDVCEEFVRIARLNVPESKFILGDIRELELQPIYDVVISHDVFCHILNLEELTTVFRKVYAAMHDNGIFAFVTSTVEDWNKTLSSKNQFDFWISNFDVTDTYVYSERYYKYNEEDMIMDVKCTCFELIDGVWQRSDNSALVKIYFESDIKSTLANVGFIEIDTYKNEDIDDYPAIFVCRKPCVSQ